VRTCVRARACVVDTASQLRRRCVCVCACVCVRVCARVRFRALIIYLCSRGQATAATLCMSRCVCARASYMYLCRRGQPIGATNEKKLKKNKRQARIYNEKKLKKIERASYMYLCRRGQPIGVTHLLRTHARTCQSTAPDTGLFYFILFFKKYFLKNVPKIFAPYSCTYMPKHST